jgi:thioredoxin reductase (NADPH)
MLDSVLTYVLGGIVILASVIPYLRRRLRKESAARERFENLKISGLHEATTMHPHIDITLCIGCSACVKACPEEDVLGIISGKAALIHGAKCVGHGLCATACPVGAIELLLAAPGRSAEIPVLDDQLQTNVPGMYIVGELGGQGLIRNAVRQGAAVIDNIAAKLPHYNAEFDVAIVGGGPGGLAAGLAAKQRGLRYTILEQGEIGGAILHYPRAKLVMTQPLDLPLYGKVKQTEISKEDLVALWNKVIKSTGLEVQTGERVESIVQQYGTFLIHSTNRIVHSATVVLALGRRGTPRKLGIPGEEIDKVMYRLIDASTYTNNKLLVVGGGDSAVEATIGLSIQTGNEVTLSYRRDKFSHIKERNRIHLEQQISNNRIKVIFNSNLIRIDEQSVELRSGDTVSKLANDFVFIFIGGEMPFAFLARAGILVHQQVV